MRASSVAAIVLVLLVVLPGCSGGGDGSSEAIDTSALTSSEIGWIRGYSAWTIAIYDDDLGAGTGSKLVAACRDRLEEVGPAPAERLRPAVEMAPAVCPLLTERGMRRRAHDMIEAIDALVLPFLRDQQPLPLHSGTTQNSRADIALSALAFEEVEYPVEVRCWSDGDWRRVVGEDNAWNDDDADHETLVGWGDDYADRIHMLLEQCNAISGLRAARFDSWSKDDRIEATDSLSTLGHEIQHFLLDDASEAEVECAAARSLVDLARSLGLDRGEAAAASELYWTDVFPDLPFEYVDEDCRRAGT